MQIAVLGLGEAGSHFANDLVKLGHQVSGWDPDPKRKLNKAIRIAESNCDAVRDADIILNVNLSSEAAGIAEEVKNNVKISAVFCEMNTSSPKDKKQIENILDNHCEVLDVAIMTPVPGKGINVPLSVSGKRAEQFKSALSVLKNISIVEGEVGDAAQLKLLRSIVYKGVAAVICEAMEAAHHFDKETYMRNQIASIIGDNRELVDRFVSGSKLHAVRRGHEMEAVVQMLEDVGLSSIMSSGAVNNLNRYSSNK